MKKNPFLIDKKIIITDNETKCLKGGSASLGLCVLKTIHATIALSVVFCTPEN